ncbi:RpiB/LacA/LacB family sugar-phosphate isomerase [Candidatus Berkelbacteria bacterium]|nr:RpiB/LacA/LacB family sugar-phosphate isomerase [Candidatus Berkelbacteria bacterium]
MNHLTPIYLGADHAGFEMKEQLKQFLSQAGHQVEDFGAPSLVPDDDYPQYALAVAERVASTPESRGILLCGNGQGVCIAANKVAGIRAVSSWNPDHAATTRADDDANVLCLAARHLDQSALESIATAWLATPFSAEERHTRRIAQITERERA